VNNQNHYACFLRSKENTTDLSVNQCIVIQTYFCRAVTSTIIVELDRDKNFEYDTMDFKYTTDLGKSGRFGVHHIPSNQAVYVSLAAIASVKQCSHLLVLSSISYLSPLLLESL